MSTPTTPTTAAQPAATATAATVGVALKPAAPTPMTLGHKFAVALCVGLVILLVFAAREWLREHDARMQAEATQTTQQQAIAASEKQIDAAKSDETETAAQLAAQLAMLQAQQRQPATAPDLAAQLNAILKPAAPIIATPVAKDTPAAQLPGAPAVEIPQADVQGLRDYTLKCQENADKASACAKTSADLQDQLAATRAQVAAETKEAAAWRAAARGGSILHRLTHGLKCLAIGGAASAAGAYADKGNPAEGAALGAIGGGAACALF